MWDNSVCLHTIQKRAMLHTSPDNVGGSMAKTQTAIKPDAIKEMLKDGRTEAFDWVAENVDPKTLAGTMCAMANGDGGTILVGVGKKYNDVRGVQDQDTAIGKVLPPVGVDVRAAAAVRSASRARSMPLRPMAMV